MRLNRRSIGEKRTGVFGDGTLSWHLIIPLNRAHTSSLKAWQCQNMSARKARPNMLFKIVHNEWWPWGQHLRSFPKQTATSRPWMTETWPGRQLCSCVWQTTRGQRWYMRTWSVCEREAGTRSVQHSLTNTHRCGDNWSLILVTAWCRHAFLQFTAVLKIINHRESQSTPLFLLPHW